MTRSTGCGQNVENPLNAMNASSTTIIVTATATHPPVSQTIGSPRLARLVRRLRVCGALPTGTAPVPPAATSRAPAVPVS